MEAYSSFPNVMNFKRSGIAIGAIYKRYALLFDRVIFNRHGCPIGRNDLFPNLPAYIAALAGENDGEISLLQKNRKFANLFVDLLDVIEDHEKVDNEVKTYISDYDQKQISSFSWGRNLIDQEIGIDNHYKEYKAAAIVGNDLISDLSYNFYLKETLAEFSINLAPLIGEALTSSLCAGGVNDLFSSNILIPNFEKLSWNQILDIREDKYIKEFRKKVFSCSNRQSPIDEILSNDLDSELWDLANQCQPNLGKKVIEVILSNLPLPTVVNPFGLYYGAKTLAQEYQKTKKSSWVYFVHSLRKVSQKGR